MKQTDLDWRNEPLGPAQEDLRRRRLENEDPLVVKPWPFDSDAPVKLTCHILRAGHPLCNFHPGTPDQWPKDHRWISELETDLSPETLEMLCRECSAIADGVASVCC